MNILIILKNDKNEKTLEDKYGILLEHARYWVQEGSEVYLFGIKILDKWKDAGFHFVKSPGKIPANLRAYIWFLTDTHPKVDIVIQSVGILNFNFKKTATFLYLPLKTSVRRYRKIFSKIKRNMVNLILRMFFKRSSYLVSEYAQKKALLASKINKNNIFLLKRGIPLKLRRNFEKRKVFGKTILFSGKGKGFSDLMFVVEVFKQIDRKREGWKFSLLVERNLLKKVKNIVGKNDFQSRVNVWAYKIRNSLIQEIGRSDILLDISVDRDSLFNDLISMSLGTLVVTVKNDILVEYPGFEKCSVLSDHKDPQEMAGLIIEMENNQLNRERLIKEGLVFTEEYFWDNLSKNSIKFLGSVRPE